MIARPLAPLWLARPSRFATLTPIQARAALFALAVLLVATLLALGTPLAPRDPAPEPGDQTDIVLYQTVVGNVRHGGNYYRVTAEALRGGDYPLRPFVVFRLPTLAVVEAALPDAAMIALLYALVAATALAWWKRLNSAFVRASPRIVAMLVLAAGLVTFIQADLRYFHEVWAGLFIALSLALRRREDWLPAVAFGLAAVLVRETAAPYLVLMAFFAILEGSRREAAAWGLALAVLAAALGAHAHAVAQVVHPLDPASPGWAGMLGFGFFVKTMAISTALALVPLWLAAPLVGIALFGWAAWADDLGIRMLALLSGYAAILAVVGRTDTFYWGLLVAPAMLVGIAFAVDGVRDLIHAALDQRRITVRRVVR
ncbi:hypothetical protein [Sphingomonas oligophenolica]|uniref:DUF2029 domain-containing protein n=1 Tax=Sphingomonas oligophenolica TaxID=301154 RepID=A0A502CKU3_9SPHN|nr:hypothetical protein [Sphingomonas oligophenolica]TPG12739.1 hypothetical protein EAH84_08180 [Sphingomonas oligophenolica]